MSPDPMHMDDEDTDAVIARHRSARRRTAVTVVIPVVLVIGLLAVWVTTTGRSCDERFWKGIRETGGARGGAMSGRSWVVNPGASHATLNITVSESAEVWVDNESIGTVEDKSLQLLPGTREVVTQTRRGGQMATTLTVDAGEVFEVFFNRENNRIRLYRLTTDGQKVEIP